MKRIVMFTLSIMLLVAGVALAQSRRGPGGPPPMQMHRGANPLADYLALTADQKAAWETIQSETRESVHALHEQERTKLAALLTSDQQVKFAAFQAASEFLHQRGPGGGPHPPR
jgi:Spy/CpxP family protein refolding chaperone